MPLGRAYRLYLDIFGVLAASLRAAHGFSSSWVQQGLLARCGVCGLLIVVFCCRLWALGTWLQQSPCEGILGAQACSCGTPGLAPMWI